MIIEEYKDIEGYEDLYQISNYGNVKSLPKKWKAGNGSNQHHNGKLLVFSIDKGYARVFLFKNENKKRFSVHILVAKHFIPNPENKPEVNHKDGIKINNFVNNLEWNTSKENIKHAFSTGLHKILKGSQVGSSKLTEEQVLYIRNITKNNIKVEKGFWKNLAKEFNVFPSAISKIKNNQHWKHLQ